jgi:hypothetical protein
LHPFLQQIEYANQNGFTGYNFDSYDIVPRDESRNYNDYFTPLGNSLTYGYTTQLVRKRVDAGGGSTYQRIVEWQSGQTYNFREMRRPEGDRQPFSKAFSSFLFSFDSWDGALDYEYFPYQPIDDTHSRHAVSTSFDYVWEKGIRRNVLVYERSIGLGYTLRRTGTEVSGLRAKINYSISDYVMPTTHLDYSFIQYGQNGKLPQWLDVGAGLRFQSPSQCWKLDIGAQRTTCEKPPNNFCFTSQVDLSLNLTGSGFGGFDEATQSKTN